MKEPQPEEFPFLHRNQVLFTYLHLAADPVLAQALIDSGCLAIAYETVQLADRRLPLLEPMSLIAGRLSIQVGARYLECHGGGRGLLLGGAPGVEPARVTVLGAGTVGSEAARLAGAMHADVTLIDKDVSRLRQLEPLLPPNVKTRASDPVAIREILPRTDLLIGAVLSAGDRAPVLVKRDGVATMPSGAVIIDVAIDQGGCIETSKVTNHEDPTFIDEGVVHYGVTNMPGAVARTSTFALSNATCPYLLALATKGVDGALKDMPELSGGINVRDGKIQHPGVANALRGCLVPPELARSPP